MCRYPIDIKRTPQPITNDVSFVVGHGEAITIKLLMSFGIEPTDPLVFDYDDENGCVTVIATKHRVETESEMNARIEREEHYNKYIASGRS